MLLQALHGLGDQLRIHLVYLHALTDLFEERIGEAASRYCKARAWLL